MTVDVLGQLLEWSFRGISFPAIGHTIKGGQSNTVHQPMDRDGSKVEMTGRNSDVFQVEAIFDQGVVSHITEFWSDLYPNRFLKMLDALRDRTTGELGHPLRGFVKVKATEWEEKVDPSRRSGVTLSITFVETNDDDVADRSLFDSSPLEFAAAEILNLNAELGILNPPLLPKGLDEGQSLAELAGEIRGIHDQTALAVSKAAGKINGAIGTVTSINDSVERSFETIGSAAGSIADSANRALDSLNRLKEQALFEERASVGIKIADGDWTWAQAMQSTANSLEDLQRLNPSLGGKSVIAKGSLVKHKR